MTVAEAMGGEHANVVNFCFEVGEDIASPKVAGAGAARLGWCRRRSPHLTLRLWFQHNDKGRVLGASKEGRRVSFVYQPREGVCKWFSNRRWVRVESQSPKIWKLSPKRRLVCSRRTTCIVPTCRPSRTCTRMHEAGNNER